MYRGANLQSNLIEKLKNSKSKYIISEEILSTTFNLGIALDFAYNALFEIQIN